MPDLKNAARAGPPLPEPGPGSVPRIPLDEEGPVFASPWEARAFALVVHLHQQGHFTWAEWVEHLSAEIAAAGRAPGAGPAPSYYELWMAAAAKLFAAKGLLGAAELRAKEAFIAAHPVPPHGKARRKAVAIDRGARPRANATPQPGPERGAE